MAGAQVSSARGPRLRASRGAGHPSCLARASLASLVNEDLRRAACAALAAWALLARTAAAQTRPLQTEEATTARQGTLVLEVGADAIQGEPNFLTGRRRDRWAGPVLRLVHSPSDNVEIDLESGILDAKVGLRALEEEPEEPRPAVA